MPPVRRSRQPTCSCQPAAVRARARCRAKDTRSDDCENHATGRSPGGRPGPDAPSWWCVAALRAHGKRDPLAARDLSGRRPRDHRCARRGAWGMPRGAWRVENARRGRASTSEPIGCSRFSGGLPSALEQGDVPALAPATTMVSVSGPLGGTGAPTSAPCTAYVRAPAGIIVNHLVDAVSGDPTDDHTDGDAHASRARPAAHHRRAPRDPRERIDRRRRHAARSRRPCPAHRLRGTPRQLAAASAA